MQLALSGLTALRVWRAIRAGKLPGVRVGARVDLPAPDPAPASRWTQKAFDLAFLGIDEPIDQKRPLHIAVPDAKLRIRTRGTACSVFTRIPAGSFVDVGHGVAIACPELVFAEMGAAMSRPVQLLLGYELCDGYSRDDVDPREGEIAYSVDPLTTPEAIGEYLEGCRHMPQIWQSREALPYLLGNAWSPIEAIIAQMIVLDPCESGYGLGEIELNRRVGAAKKGSRVPDILFAGTHVGLNYDGGGHFGLDDVIAAAGTDREKEVVAKARSKIVDDKRRDRELLVAGYSVIAVTSEDLYEPGGLDAVMAQVIELIERETGRELTEQRDFLNDERMASRRQRFLWSLLPGKRGLRILQQNAATKRVIEDYLRTVREADKAFRLFESNGPKLGTWLYILLNEQTGRFT